MFVQAPRFSAVCAFVDGYDFALQRGALSGFREWLLIGSKEWTNLPWWALIRLRHDETVDLSKPPSEEEESVLLPELASALNSFARAYEEGGLAKIYYDYNNWIIRSSDHSTKIFRTRLRGKSGRGK